MSFSARNTHLISTNQDTQRPSVGDLDDDDLSKSANWPFTSFEPFTQRLQDTPNHALQNAGATPASNAKGDGNRDIIGTP